MVELTCRSYSNRTTSFFICSCNLGYPGWKEKQWTWNAGKASLWVHTFKKRKGSNGLGFSSCLCHCLLFLSLIRVLYVKIELLQFSCSVVSDSLRLHGSQHARPPYPLPTPGAYSNPCPSSRWCRATISSSVAPFSSCPQSLPASGSFPMSQLFTWGGQNIGVSASASVLPMITEEWSPLGWIGWISWQSKGLSRVFSNTTVQKYQFFCAQLSL